MPDEHPRSARAFWNTASIRSWNRTYIDSLLELRGRRAGAFITRFDQVGHGHGAHLLRRAEPAEHSRAHGAGQGDPPRVYRHIRAAVLVDADYSQIELRVLAHMSGDETMISAFREGQDIHARTAAEVYGVPLDAGDATRCARGSKAVNFGIVYGISDFTLAKNISVSRKEAREFIERYFERYPGVKRYHGRSGGDRNARRATSTTLMGRRRYLPELSSANFNVRAFGERCAMNSPIQGTAADIIKLAMIARRAKRFAGGKTCARG